MLIIFRLLLKIVVRYFLGMDSLDQSGLEGLSGLVISVDGRLPIVAGFATVVQFDSGVVA
jgi:hypothetical protein